MLFRDLNIGADASEQDPIEKLESYFVNTQEFRDVEAHKHHFVIGNRGTGKSAILKILQKRVSGRTIYITPERYSYSVLKSIIEEKPNAKWGQEASFASAWKYSIIVLLLKDIETQTKGVAKGARKKVHDYLRDNHANVEHDGITLLYKFLERMQSIKAGEYGVSFQRAETLQKLYKLEELDVIKDDLQSILSLHPYTVLIDELDTGWDNTEFAQYFIAGLFAATQDLNRMANLNVVVSLRQDIFESLPTIYSDQEKIRDQIVRIKWNDHSLCEMASSRFSVALKSVGEQFRPTEKDAWFSLFEETLQFRNMKSKNYIVDRTLFRPRDLIQFFKSIFKTTNKNLGEKLTYDDIVNGEKEFSESKFKDLCAEYQYSYPNLNALLETFRGSTNILTKQELEYRMLEFTLSPTGILCGEWAIEKDAEQLTRILYEVGFIKLYLAGAQTGGMKAGSGYFGVYELSSKPNLLDIQRFQISLVFKQYLRLKERKE